MDKHEWKDGSVRLDSEAEFGHFETPSGRHVIIPGQVVAEVLRLADFERSYTALRVHIPEWEAIERERDRLAEEVERLKRDRARAREQLVSWERNLTHWPVPHRLAMRSAIDRCVPEES